MSTTASVYLNFKGNCKEAMIFYQSCFGGKLEIQSIVGSPMEHYCTIHSNEDVLHSSLTNAQFMLMASDMYLGELITGNNFSVFINCSSEEEITSFFSKIAVGGTIIDSLKTQFWGAIFGVVTDKFGIRWSFNYELPK
ncbi:MAG: VOC family protein [Flavobacteriia bacterium]|nr:VOC family protein [Flavobacteriia bacterium]